MSFLLHVSNLIVPMMVLGIVTYGICQKVSVYDVFIKGAKKGIGTVIKIMPTLVGLMVAVGILRASGFLEFIARIAGRFFSFVGFPAELVPLAIVRMFSSSAAVGLAVDLFKEYGPDSAIGTIASIMMSCTETIFYTMSVYFMTAKIKKTRYTLPGALLATLAGIVVSVWLGS